jgi:DNA-binding transcriptional LysR family regulator
LRVAANPSFGAGLLPKVSLVFRQRAPRAHLDILTTGHSAVVERVALRQADIGLTQFEPDDPLLQRELLGRFPMCVALPLSSPIARQPVVAPRDLVGLPMIGYEKTTPIGSLVEAHLAAHGIVLRSTITVRFPMIACMFVNAGVGAAIVDPFMVLTPECWHIALRPLDPAPQTEIWMLRHGSRPPSHTGRLFAQALRHGLLPESRI